MTIIPRKYKIHPPRIFRMLYPDALWKLPVETGEKAVYLTFDDGPHPATTQFILEQLEKYGAKATFFMVGENVLRFPDLTQKIIDSGHSVGNHTMRHLQGRNTTLREYLEEIERENRILPPTRLFRPPHGIMKRSQYKALRSDHRIVMFDMVTMDYDSGMTSEKILDNLRRYVSPGSVIVFHDSKKAEPRLVATLPATLQWLRQQGYECRRIEMD